LFGFRPVDVNPDRAMNFKVADYQRGMRDSRSLFTRVALKGGPIEPKEIVDAYLNANRAIFNVRKNLKGDMNAARLLNISDESYYGALGRISASEVGNLEENIFTPFTISENIQQAFATNAEKIGAANPFESAIEAIAGLQEQMAGLDLNLPEFPFFENPLLPIMQDTPLTPTSLNLPSVDAGALQNQVNGGQFSNLSNKQKFDILFPNG